MALIHMIVIVLHVFLCSWAHASSHTDSAAFFGWGQRLKMRLNNGKGRTDSTNSPFLVLNKKIFKTVDKEEKPMNKFGIKISRKAPFNLILYIVVAASSQIISLYNPVAAVLFEKTWVIGSIYSYILFRIKFGSTIKLLPKIMNAIPADTKLNLTVQALVKKSNITIPISVFITNSTEMNAFAVSFYKADNCTTSGAAVVINKGLIDSVTAAELKSIIAHECGHIHHRDFAHRLRLLSLQSGFGLCVFSGMFLLIDAYHKNEAIKWFKGTLEETASNAFNLRILQSESSGLFHKGVLLVSFGSVLTFIGSLLQAAKGRQQELQADAHAKKICGGAPLISFFEKMNGILSIKDYLSLSLIPGGLLIWYTGIYYGSLMSLCINSILIPIAIVNLNWTTWVRLLISKLNSIGEKEVASKKGFFNWLKYHAYSTHPPIKERIEALRLPSN